MWCCKRHLQIFHGLAFARCSGRCLGKCLGYAPLLTCHLEYQSLLAKDVTRQAWKHDLLVNLMPRVKLSGKCARNVKPGRTNHNCARSCWYEKVKPNMMEACVLILLILHNQHALSERSRFEHRHRTTERSMQAEGIVACLSCLAAWLLLSVCCKEALLVWEMWWLEGNNHGLR